SSRQLSRCHSATTGLRTRLVSHTASCCRRSRWHAGSASASSPSHARESRSRCSGAWRTTRSPPRTRSRRFERWWRTSITSTRPSPRLPVRALLCPASLKGVLTARDAVAALARGARSAGADVVELPIADGGEGTAEALHAALGGEWRQAIVNDPLGRPISARWLLLQDGRAVGQGARGGRRPLLPHPQ